MNSILKLCAILGITVSSSFYFNAKPTLAQAQSFSQCVLTLYGGPFSARDAAKNCLTAFRGKPLNEEFTSCVRSLYNGPFNSRDSSEYCQKAFANSSSSSESSNNNGNNGGTTIIINPNQSSQQTRPVERRTQTQCVNKMLNQVWDDVHCSYNNPMFERRTVYLD